MLGTVFLDDLRLRTARCQVVRECARAPLLLLCIADSVLLPPSLNAMHFPPADLRATLTDCSYAIAGVLYASVGVLGYIGMSDANTPAGCAAPPGGSSSCAVSSNFLQLFGTTFGNSK